MLAFCRTLQLPFLGWNVRWAAGLDARHLSDNRHVASHAGSGSRAIDGGAGGGGGQAKGKNASDPSAAGPFCIPFGSRLLLNKRPRQALATQLRAIGRA